MVKNQIYPWVFHSSREKLEVIVKVPSPERGFNDYEVLVLFNAVAGPLKIRLKSRYTMITDNAPYH